MSVYDAHHNMFDVKQHLDKTTHLNRPHNKTMIKHNYKNIDGHLVAHHWRLYKYAMDCTVSLGSQIYALEYKADGTYFAGIRKHN